VLLLLGLWIFFMRQMQTGGNKALSFGKSKAKLLSASGKKAFRPRSSWWYTDRWRAFRLARCFWRASFRAS
jgi:hypothetical protein